MLPTSAIENEQTRSVSLFSSWYGRETLLAKATLVVLALTPLLLVAASIDDRTISGVNIWIKPLKFNISIVVYLGTLTWFAGWIDRSLMSKFSYRLYRNILCGTLLFMLPWLYSAALIGEPAHFNREHPILAPMYGMMGVVSVLFTTGALVYGVLIFTNKHSTLGTYFRFAVSYSLLVSFIFTVVMAGELASMESHWIGGTASDEHGLWLLGWSRDGGDLRVAHFFSLHAMQFIPLVALLGLPKSLVARPRLSALVLSLAYCMLLFYVYFQAKNGNAFMPWLG